MKIIELKNLSNTKLNALLKRPSQDSSKILKNIKLIVSEVKKHGLPSAIKYAKKYDSFNSERIFVTEEEFNIAEKVISSEDKYAIKTAYKNIYKFHKLQFPQKISTEISKGILCYREFKPIENVGLYIPGGNAILPSTVLMLGVPAKIAGCKRIVISTPIKNDFVNPYLLYAAKLCGIKEVIKIGGAQGIALLAYGSDDFAKVDKIFGPGSQFVTLAKILVSQDFDGAQIDMPAGPSEVLIIADKFANPKFVAADLLSQAEHGYDSQVILITNDKILIDKVLMEIKSQMKLLQRINYVEKSLKNSLAIITNTLEEAIDISNNYAPEHLIVNVNTPMNLVKKIQNAGSVFIGQYSSESAGDYASGTNHSLPTNGLAKVIGGVSVEMFMKSISFQRLTKNGLKNLSDVIIKLAEIEGLQAHANAVKIRMKNDDK